MLEKYNIILNILHFMTKITIPSSPFIYNISFLLSLLFMMKKTLNKNFPFSSTYTPHLIPIAKPSFHPIMFFFFPNHPTFPLRYVSYFLPKTTSPLHQPLFSSPEMCQTNHENHEYIVIMRAKSRLLYRG